MKALQFQAHGRARSFALTSLSQVLDRPRAARAMPRAAAARTAMAADTPFDPTAFLGALRKSKTMRLRLGSADPSQIAIVASAGPVAARAAGPRRAGAMAARPTTPSAMTLVTPTIIVEGARSADLKAARNAGARVLDEGLDGKALLGVDTIDALTPMIKLLTAREVGSVTPNFLRRFTHLPRSTTPRAWAHGKIKVGAAWKITRGDPGVSVAVLDEGVDTKHISLRAAVVGQRDFIGDNGNSAKPDGDDAHGTACAGIVVSRSPSAPGIAPKCSLLAARIAMDDGSGHWVFDDYATADAIDWSWRSGASVISNSWGGGLPSDAISRAFGRARTQGRNGKGCVVCIAAGNDQIEVDFPGDLSGYVTVGASNPADQRKTRASSDGESWWGSNHGPTLWLLAPGVFIETTDISGKAGYSTNGFTKTFNGTSAATPHVAAAAALMLTINPALTASDVRTILASTAKRLGGQTTRTDQLGHGRLDVGAAVAAAKKHT